MLRDYPFYSQDIQRLNEELNQTLQLKLETQNTLKAQSIDGMPHGAGISDQTYQAVEQSIDRHDEHIVYLSNRIREIYDKKELIDSLLPKLTMEEYRVVDLYYFKGYRLWRVARETYSSKTSCWRIKCSAIEKLEKSLT